MDIVTIKLKPSRELALLWSHDPGLEPGKDFEPNHVVPIFRVPLPHPAPALSASKSDAVASAITPSAADKRPDQPKRGRGRPRKDATSPGKTAINPSSGQVTAPLFV